MFLYHWKCRKDLQNLIRGGAIAGWSLYLLILFILYFKEEYDPYIVIARSWGRRWIQTVPWEGLFYTSSTWVYSEHLQKGATGILHMPLPLLFFKYSYFLNKEKKGWLWTKDLAPKASIYIKHFFSLSAGNSIPSQVE